MWTGKLYLENKQNSLHGDFTTASRNFAECGFWNARLLDSKSFTGTSSHCHPPQRHPFRFRLFWGRLGLIFGVLFEEAFFFLMSPWDHSRCSETCLISFLDAHIPSTAVILVCSCTNIIWCPTLRKPLHVIGEYTPTVCVAISKMERKGANGSCEGYYLVISRGDHA